MGVLRLGFYVDKEADVKVRFAAFYLVLVLGSVIMLVPFYWMVVTSFKVASEVISYPPTWLPRTPTLGNYIRMFVELPIGMYYRNSAFVTVVKTTVMVFTSALMGYIFGKFEFRGRDLIFSGIIATMIVPFQVYMISLYLMMVGLNWHDSHVGLIVPYIFSAYATFLFRQFMYTLPSSLIEAARIDGCGEFSIFYKIILPLSKPVLVTLIIFYFMWMWNDFLWPLVLLTSQSKLTLPVGLAVFSSEFGSDYGLIMSGAAISVVPVLIVFIIFQRRIIEGVSLTGLKG